jgi:hypothetical protein
MSVAGQAATFRSLLIVVATAIATIAAFDIAIGLVVKPTHRREVEDGVEDYRKSDPQVLVLGSSHARTFEAVGSALEARTAGSEKLVSIPVEYGKLDSYRWVLEHRLLPLMDERGADGRRLRKNLSRLILVTEWWDSCGPPPSLNLPSRAWTLSDFGTDVLEHGLTDFNRNYLQTRWRRLLHYSALAQDRGHFMIHEYLRSLVSAHSKSDFDERAREWQSAVELGTSCVGDPAQMAALRAIIDTMVSRRVDVTLLLFPRMPITITAMAKETTLKKYAEMVRAIATSYHLKLVDFTTTSPLADGDFMADFDHVTATGNRAFADWALNGDLRFLLTAAESAIDGAKGGSATP